MTSPSRMKGAMLEPLARNLTAIPFASTAPMISRSAGPERDNSLPLTLYRAGLGFSCLNHYSPLEQFLH